MNLNRPNTDMKSGSNQKKGRGRKKLPSLARLRRKLDQVFSKWIRGRDAPFKGIGPCYTCNRNAVLEAGHFIPRQHAATRWDERNVNGQCSYCNRWQHGNAYAYGIRLAAQYGQAVVDELWASKRQAVKWSRSDLEAMIDKYK